MEQGQKPLSLLVTAGQRHDSPQFQPVLDGIRVPALARADRAPSRTRFARTERTVPARTVHTCANAGSGARSRKRLTRCATARSSVPAAGARPSSTRTTTRGTFGR
ncbi:hypothetical protein ACFC0C_26550 [Streptomyces sp. NPDC056178]|uniref:hypothetical protein n=1 Tax=unclassified Streptomyces TaxID=2593676 RepID=UPI0035D8C400